MLQPLYSQETAPDTYWLGGWVGSRVVEKHLPSTSRPPSPYVIHVQVKVKVNPLKASCLKIADLEEMCVSEAKFLFTTRFLRCQATTELIRTPSILQTIFHWRKCCLRFFIVSNWFRVYLKRG
jgi:hypothetical protein